MPLPAPSLREPVAFPAPLPLLLVNNNNNSDSSCPDPLLPSFSLTFPFSGTSSLLPMQSWGPGSELRVGSMTDQNSHAWAAPPSLLSLLPHSYREHCGHWPSATLL